MYRVATLFLTALLLAGCGAVGRPGGGAVTPPASIEQPAANEDPSKTAEADCAPLVLPPEPKPEDRDAEIKWEPWFDLWAQKTKACLDLAETWNWSDEQMEEWLGVQVHRNGEEPYRWVQLGPRRMPVGTMRPSHYWVQWQDAEGVVRSQTMDPMDSGTYVGHRVFVTEDGDPLLVVLLDSVIAPNAGSVWVWRLEGDAWKPMTDALEGVARTHADVELNLSDMGPGGLQVTNWAYHDSAPYLGFREGRDRPHFVMCRKFDDDLIRDCITASWSGGRFQVASKESWGTEVKPIKCRLLTLKGEEDLWAKDFKWAESRFGKPAEETVDGHLTVWRYPQQRLTISFWGGRVAHVRITQGELASGLRVGDSLERAIAIHGRPIEQPDGKFVWEYFDCLLELSAEVEDGRIVALEIDKTHLE